MDMSMEETDDEHFSDEGQQQGPSHTQAQAQVHDQEESDEEDMSMEMTQSYGRGVITHQHQQEQEEGDESFMTNTSTRSDEEKTMEFTIAIGGFLPAQPPTGAKKGRASVGYNHLDNTGTAAIVPGEEEEDMEMDETVAFGGIINNANVDDTISTNASDDTVQGRDRTMTFNFGDIRTAASEEQANMGVDVDVEVDLDMDMTTVGGGIHSHSHSHLHAHTHVQSHNIFAQSAPSAPITTSITPKSPHRTLTRPSGSTPSFARPTTSSAQKAKSPEKQKEKRNIFGPSPSPAKSLAMTPRKSGMGIAGEVAKRLSFGSVTSHSSGEKRRAEDDEEEVATKRLRLSTNTSANTVPGGLGLGDSIFGRPRLSAPSPVQEEAQPLTRVGGTPRKSLATEPSRGTPRKSLAPSQTPVKGSNTPRKSVAPGSSSTPAKSPRKSMIPSSNIQPEEDDEVEMELEEEEVRGEDWDPPVIGLSSFLQMAGVEFVDTLPSMTRRKSGGRGLGEFKGGLSSSFVFLFISLVPFSFWNLFIVTCSMYRCMREERRVERKERGG
jgi:kinetochore protein Spc7/SPC105